MDVILVQNFSYSHLMCSKASEYQSRIEKVSLKVTFSHIKNYSLFLQIFHVSAVSMVGNTWITNIIHSF